MSARAEDGPDGTRVQLSAGEPASWDVDLTVDGPETVAEERLLAPLRVRARAVNLGRVLRLLDLVAAAEAGRLDEEGRSEAEGLAHQVVGSAGTFGSPAASYDAEAVERYFADGDPTDGGRGRLRGGASGVRGTLERLVAEFGG